MRRNAWTILGLLVGTAALGVYWTSAPMPANQVESMGDGDDQFSLKDWLAFGGMVLGFGTAIVNLIKSVIDARTTRRP